MEPTTIEWWVTPLTVAAIGIASLQARRPSTGHTWLAGAVFAAALFVANGAGSILPQTNLRTDYWYQANGFLIRNAHKGDTILTDGGFISDLYLTLYTDAEVVPVHAVTSQRLEQILSEPHDGRCWVSCWAFDPLPEVERTGYFTKLVPDPALIAAKRTLVSGRRGRMVKRDENPMQDVWELMPQERGRGQLRHE